jgi:hypothetical protein
MRRSISSSWLSGDEPRRDGTFEFAKRADGRAGLYAVHLPSETGGSVRSLMGVTGARTPHGVR